ncbi:hypothetical protein D6D05_07131 [Aureobasidium pullulans]|nr:hypothetical protein D6D05_07131 [Aureobasidium pullulans]
MLSKTLNQVTRRFRKSQPGSSGRFTHEDDEQDFMEHPQSAGADGLTRDQSFVAKIKLPSPDALGVVHSVNQDEAPTMFENRNDCALPVFRGLRGDNEREQRATTRPLGTFNVVLNPNSFARLAEYSGEAERFPGFSQGSPLIKIESEDPDLVVLAEFEGSPFDSLLPSMEPQTINIRDQVAHIQAVKQDITQYGIEDMSVFLMHWQQSVSKRLIPAMTLCNTGSQGCSVIHESRTFQPLYHAICAVSMLDLAFKGQRQLLPRAFRQYDQAITTCISSTVKPTGSLIYFHYILLVFDICCADQDYLPDGHMWTHHFQRLSCLAYSSDSVSELQAHLLTYTLYLDAQSCLAGNTDSGVFVRTYQMYDSTLPRCHEAQRYWQHASRDSAEANFSAACFALSDFMQTCFAELSQLALQIRHDVDMGLGDLAAHQKLIIDFRDQLRTSWNLKCPDSSSRSSIEPGTKLFLQAKSVFAFVSLQYSAAMIYLHTSMYRGQQMHISYLQRKEVNFHQRLVLVLASVMISPGALEQTRVVFPVFLAGVVSSKDHDRNRAIGLLRLVESTAIGNN